MTISERLFNVLIGLSAISWSILGLTSATESVRALPVRCCVAALNLSVGLLFIFRKPLVKDGTWQSFLRSLPSFLTCGVAFRFSPPTDSWPLHAELIFVTGTVLTLAALVYLGRCFAIFPAIRGMVDRGPYRYIRHPVYAGESLLVLACFLAGPSLITIWPLVLAVPCLIVRIQAEERVMLEEPVYRDYAQRVGWRLLPGVW